MIDKKKSLRSTLIALVALIALLAFRARGEGGGRAVVVGNRYYAVLLLHALDVLRAFQGVDQPLIGCEVGVDSRDSLLYRLDAGCKLLQIGLDLAVVVLIGATTKEGHRQTCYS